MIVRFQFSFVVNPPKKLTAENESINGDPVVLVLLVRVGASKSKTGEKGSKEISDTHNHQKCSRAPEVAYGILEINNKTMSMFHESDSTSY